MEQPSNPQIVAVERLNRESVVVTFADGKSAIYSASLLYATLSQARRIDEEEGLPIDWGLKSQPTP